MSAPSTKLKEPSILLASSNCQRLIKNVSYILDAAAVQLLQDEIERNVVALFRLREEHLQFAKTIPNKLWRQRILRLYYAALNAKRAVALNHSGDFSTDVSDHKNIGELPPGFPDPNTYSTRLVNLDYGFYVGIRAAKSVDLFQKEPKTPTAQELRKLPIFTGTKPEAEIVAGAS